jgi:flagellar hook-associated protein 2
MATITSLGIGSGIDINSLVTQLVAVESRPIAQLQTAKSRLDTQVSSLGKMQSLLAALQDAANTLTSNTLWTRSIATSSDERVVGTAGGGNAVLGNYGVTVQSLAAPQTLASSSVFAAATDLVGSGTVTLELGRWDEPPTVFTPKAGSAAVAVTIEATDTLQTLRDKINSAGTGVSASIVSDASGSRLALRSTTSGVENGFRVAVADADGNGIDAAGLSRIAFDPSAGATAMTYAQAGRDAQATINGIAVTTTSNDLSGVVDGLTLQLRQPSATAVDVNVISDRQAVKDAVQKFADTFNDLARYIADQTKYDPASKVGGPLQGDSAVGGLLGRLRGLINGGSGASPVFTRLSDIGLQLQRDGTLKVDGSKLDTSVGNLAELKKALSNTDALVPGNNGLARQFATLATQVLGVDGALTTRTEGLRKLISKNQEQQQRYEDRVERYRERLVTQFSAMDANLSKLNALQSYMTAQLAALQKSTYKTD